MVSCSFGNEASEGEGAGWARAPSIYLPPERNVFETLAAETTTRQRRQVSIFVPCHSSRPGVAGPRARSHSFKVLPEGAAAAGATADDHKFECESASFGSDLSVGGIVICCWGGLPPSLDSSSPSSSSLGRFLLLSLYIVRTTREWISFNGHLHCKTAKAKVACPLRARARRSSHASSPEVRLLSLPVCHNH